MPDIFRVRSLGDAAVLAPLLAQLRNTGANLSPHDPSLVLVGANATNFADTALGGTTSIESTHTGVGGADNS
jgi:hypothetical protein